MTATRGPPNRGSFEEEEEEDDDEAEASLLMEACWDPGAAMFIAVGAPTATARPSESTALAADAEELLLLRRAATSLSGGEE